MSRGSSCCSCRAERSLGWLAVLMGLGGGSTEGDTGCMGRGLSLGHRKQEEVAEAGPRASPLPPKAGVCYPGPLISTLPACLALGGRGKDTMV